MYLLKLRLHNFRNYRQLSFTPPKGVTVLIGENGAGKTNLLEAIHLCCLGKSHRTNNDRDMICVESETCAVHATVERELGINEVGVRIYQKQAQKKLIYVNGKIVPRIGEMIGYVSCVMFSPEDLDIVKGSPQGRRKYLDMLLSKCDRSYFYALQRYQQALKQRNALLKVVAKSGNAKQLDVWDEQLSQYSEPVIIKRRNAVEALSQLATEHYNNISGKNDEEFTLEYNCRINETDSPGEELFELLKQSREDDVRRQSTTYGPHRDDMDMYLCGIDIKAFASQGQIRTATLALRLSEINILSSIQGEKPILLLDDVLSELDEFRRIRLIQYMNDIQTIITCTDMEDLRGAKPECVLRVKNGIVG